MASLCGRLRANVAYGSMVVMSNKVVSGYPRNFNDGTVRRKAQFRTISEESGFGVVRQCAAVGRDATTQGRYSMSPSSKDRWRNTGYVDYIFSPTVFP